MLHGNKTIWVNSNKMYHAQIARNSPTPRRIDGGASGCVLCVYFRREKIASGALTLCKYKDNRDK